MDATNLPEGVKTLVWDVDPASVDLSRHADYVMERVMSRGGWDAMLWLRQTYSQAELADFLLRKGARLAPRDLAYWALIAGIHMAIPQGGGTPPWAGA
jgi:hypothetical protein